MIPLIAKIGGDITGSQSQKIYYTKPSGAQGSWTASIHSAVNGEIVYITQKTDFDEAGVWKLQGWEKDANNRENYGQTYTEEIFAVGG